MRILGLIPARAGSKGIPNKNKKLLAGKPLLQYTIEAALGSKQLTEVVFSSEDAELRALAESLGALVPFERPNELATDTAASIDVVLHAIEALREQGKEYDAVCLLQVTTPFRTSQQIDDAISSFIAAEADSLISVVEVPHQYNPHWVFEPDANDLLHLATGEQSIITRRQELPQAYIRDGAIYITHVEVLQKHKSFYGDKLTYVLSDDSDPVNIDTEADWQRAEERIKKGTFTS